MSGTHSTTREGNPSEPILEILVTDTSDLDADQEMHEATGELSWNPEGPGDRRQERRGKPEHLKDEHLETRRPAHAVIDVIATCDNILYSAVASALIPSACAPLSEEHLQVKSRCYAYKFTTGSVPYHLLQFYGAGQHASF